MYNGTFVIGIRPPGAQVEIIFGADSIPEQPAGGCWRTLDGFADFAIVQSAG